MLKTLKDDNMFEIQGIYNACFVKSLIIITISFDWDHFKIIRHSLQENKLFILSNIQFNSNTQNQTHRLVCIVYLSHIL